MLILAITDISPSVLFSNGDNVLTITGSGFYDGNIYSLAFIDSVYNATVLDANTVCEIVTILIIAYI